MEIIPAIIPKTFSELKAHLEVVAGYVDTVQIDVCDGKFAPNKTWPYLGSGETYQKIVNEEEGMPYWEDVNFEFDLMVSNPNEVISDVARMGATRAYVHIESIASDALSDLIKEWNHVVEIGLALKPSTPLEVLETFLHEVSSIQCMGSDRISFGGVSLDERVEGRIADLHKRHPELIISVDIGVNAETAPRLVAAGAKRLVMGSAIFKVVDPIGAIRSFQKLG